MCQIEMTNLIKLSQKAKNAVCSYNGILKYTNFAYAIIPLKSS